MKRTDVRRASNRGAVLAAALVLALAVLAPVYAKDKDPAKDLIEKSVKASGGSISSPAGRRGSTRVT